MVQRSQSVAEPGSQRGATRNLIAGTDIGNGRIVIDRFGVHGADNSQIIDHAGCLGQQLADPGTRMAVSQKLENRRRDGKPRLIRRHCRNPLALPNGIGEIDIEVLGGALCHLRFVIEQVHLRRCTRHKEIDHSLRAGRKMGNTPQTTSLRETRLRNRAVQEAATRALPFPAPGKHARRNAVGLASVDVRTREPLGENTAVTVLCFVFHEGDRRTSARGSVLVVLIFMPFC